MGNHITAGNVLFIKLKYNNGITTLVPCFNYGAEYVSRKLKQTIEGYKDDDPFGIVRYIDFTCNYILNSAQLFASANEIMIAETIHVPHPYDLGENETVKQIERLTGVKINKKTTRKRKKE
jgi:hypothetical protein